MEFNNKKLEKTSKFINYLIAVVLSIFLISLSNKLINDVGDWKEVAATEEFEDKSIIDKKTEEIDVVDERISQVISRRTSIENTIKIAKNNYENAKESFDNWLEARKTVGSPNEDSEVLRRANELDDYYKTEQEWVKQLSSIDELLLQLDEELEQIVLVIEDERERAREERYKAVRANEVKIFLIRILFILPILVLGIYFIVKFRNHKYWPLFLGYTLFSFYAFFFGLVPYLPSYGGYVRYTVGIVLSIVLGVYTINHIKAFIERKKSELKVPTDERAKKVQLETAEKALDDHMCPSCGKDFIQKTWEKSTSKKKEVPPHANVTNFCRFCGLELFKKCDSCGTDNFAHLPYCSDCGSDLSRDEKS